MLASEFKTTVLPLGSKLLRFAGRLTRNEEEARDVIQDVFLKLWQKRESLDKIENIEAFAMRVTRNRCLDLCRGQHSFPEEDEKLKQRRDEQKDLQNEIELSETVRLVKDLISLLPEIQRTVMYLRDIEQYEYEEIAQVTDLNINAIRVNLSRARKKVREELLKQQEYGTGIYQTEASGLF